MATITVRNLTEETRRALKERAAQNNRSMEAEARAILEQAIRPEAESWLEVWLREAEKLRGDPLPIPERRPARPFELLP